MAGEDRAYTRWLLKLPCACGCGRASEEIHHRTGAGMGLKAHDYDGMPMAHRCHMAFHSASGVFKRWNKEQRRAWQVTAVRQLRERYSEDSF